MASGMNVSDVMICGIVTSLAHGGCLLGPRPETKGDRTEKTREGR